MTTEQKFILRVISDHLNKRKTESPDTEMRWETIRKYLHNHQLEGIFYHQCKAFIPKAKEFQVLYYSTIYNYTNRIQFMNELTTKLEIPWFTIKGSAVAAFYPVPALRTMGDTDIVVHTEDREMAHQVMMESGCRNDSKFSDREWVYYHNDMEFELHDHLVYSETVSKTEHEQYFNNFWDYVKNGQLDWNFHFLFVVLHLRKHLMNSGVGFRQFMDLTVLILYNKKLDWNWIQQELEKLSLLDFTRACFAFIERWFGVQPPIQAASLSDEFYESATAKIFADGIYGFNNAENEKAAAVNETRVGKNKFIVTLGKIFPSYQAMADVPYYGFLQGRPYLLPIAWIYRFIRGIAKKKTTIAIRQVKKSFASDELIRERTIMLEQWGL